jgi:hypothetical protein
LDKGGYDASDQESSKETRSEESRSKEAGSKESLREEDCRRQEDDSEEAGSQKSSGEKGEVNLPLQYCYSGRTSVRLFFRPSERRAPFQSLDKKRFILSNTPFEY